MEHRREFIAVICMFAMLAVAGWLFAITQDAMPSPDPLKEQIHSTAY